jgi:hypothetical protein
MGQAANGNGPGFTPIKPDFVTKGTRFKPGGSALSPWTIDILLQRSKITVYLLIGHSQAPRWLLS